MGAGQVVAVGGSGPVAQVARQLWGRLVADGTARVVLGSPPPGWRAVESYRAVPDARRAAMLVPDDRRLAARCLAAYPGLRPPLVRAGRSLASLAAGLGVPPGLARVSLVVPDGAPDPVTPLTLAADAVGRSGVGAAVGVRTGANAKPTLQLFAPEPVGFVKLGWEAQSAGFVAREAQVLADLHGWAGPVRVPSVLRTGSWGDHPYLVTEPLPAGVRRPRPDEGPRPDELLGLAPVVRHDLPSRTAHLVALGDRLRSAAGPGPLVADALALLDAVRRVDEPGPVVARWHGDLVPWNVARAGDGALWVWDWETAQDDVVLGLDAVHWALHAPRRTTPDGLATRLDERLPGLRRTVVAMGGSERTAAVAVAVHALAMAERGLGLAAARGGWQAVLVGPEALRALLATASGVLATHGP